MHEKRPGWRNAFLILLRNQKCRFTIRQERYWSKCVLFCLIIFLNKYTDVKAVNLSRVKRCPNGLHRLRASCHPCVINLEMIERLWRCHIKIPITLEGWQWLFIMAEKKVRNRGYAVRIDRVGVKRIRGNLQMSQTEQTQLNINQYKQLPLRTLSIQSV